MEAYLPSFLPTTSDLAGPFWDGLKHEQVVVQHCNDCDRYIFYPRPFCIHCGNDALAWTAIDGRGQVLFYTIKTDAEEQKILAIVETIEGVRFCTNLTGCDYNQVRSGLSVKPVFAHVDENVSLLLYSPDE